MSLIFIGIRNSFPFEWLCTRTRFETEASNNSEMGHFNYVAAIVDRKVNQRSFGDGADVIKIVNLALCLPL